MDEMQLTNQSHIPVYVHVAKLLILLQENIIILHVVFILYVREVCKCKGVHWCGVCTCMGVYWCGMCTGVVCVHVRVWDVYM